MKITELHESIKKLVDEIQSDAKSESIKKLVDEMQLEVKSDYPNLTSFFKNASIVCCCLGFVFIIVGICLVFLPTTSEFDRINVQSSYTEKNNKTISPPYHEVNSFISKNEHQVSWSNILYFSIKSILIVTLLATAAKYSFNLAKTFTNELFKLTNSKKDTYFRIFYLLLINKSKEPLALIQALNSYDFLNSSETTFNEKSLDPKHLDKALELICKVKAVVGSDINNKQSSSSARQ